MKLIATLCAFTDYAEATTAESGRPTLT